MTDLIAKLIFVRLRPLWEGLRDNFPATHRFLSMSSRIVFPWSRRLWMRSEGGIATGLYFKLNPRFERDFIRQGPVLLEKVWTENLLPGKVFYDVGSHIGVFAVSGARMVGPQGAVYAFEPDPENIRLIKENARRNSLAVEVVPAAVWKCSGQLPFSLAPVSDPGRMGGRLDAKEVPNSTIPVNVLSLDDFSRDRRPPSFIKIDVEGAEAEVLEGARNTITTYRPNLLIEIHNDEALHRVSVLLREYGYEFHRVVPDAPLFSASAERLKVSQVGRRCAS
ncbi:MAG: FkbM family methyltransferase [Acidobacteriia bacterium]|nr:FkbM family methyltransferase [Terriglobia bacterium]